MTEAQILRGIRSAANKRAKADQAKRDATEDLERLVRDAQAVGVPITQIASEAGLIRQGVYLLLGRQ